MSQINPMTGTESGLGICQSSIQWFKSLKHPFCVSNILTKYLLLSRPNELEVLQKTSSFLISHGSPTSRSPCALRRGKCLWKTLHDPMIMQLKYISMFMCLKLDVCNWPGNLQPEDWWSYDQLNTLVSTKCESQSKEVTIHTILLTIKF